MESILTQLPFLWEIIFVGVLAFHRTRALGPPVYAGRSERKRRK